MFINYSPISGYSLNTFRKPDTSYSDNVVDFVKDVTREMSASCPFEGAIDALNDGSLFTDDDYDVVEDLSNFLLYGIE